MMRFRPQFGFSLWLTGGVVSSLALILLHFGPVYGSPLALVLTILLQFYLSGYLVARALGRHRAPNWIARFGWVLVSAFALNVSLGAVARLAHLPIPTYVIMLHFIMLVLAQLKPLVAMTPALSSDNDRGW